VLLDQDLGLAAILLHLLASDQSVHDWVLSSMARLSTRSSRSGNHGYDFGRQLRITELPRSMYRYSYSPDETNPLGSMRPLAL